MKASTRILACFVSFGILVTLPLRAGERKPNILVIVADDLGYADVSFNPRHPKEVTAPLPTDKPLDGKDILPVLCGESATTSRDLFWCSGSEEGWWAVRSGNWKLVGEKGKLRLFDLSKDVSEKNDLAGQMPEKIAELTKLHDAWLVQMQNPIKAGAKHYGMAEPRGSTTKKSKAERRESRAGRKRAAAP